jgi:hypothetical protein
MPVVRDFRKASFRLDRIDRCGRHVGSKLYWKLYAIENTLRIVINSVLTAQVGANWWIVAVDPGIVARTSRFRAHYTAKPRNASPGFEDIYLLFLSDLTNILRQNSHLFLPVIADTNNWISTLEAIRVPRNLVGHMNFPNAFDKAAIDSAYLQLPSLIGQVTNYGLPIIVPK